MFVETNCYVPNLTVVRYGSLVKGTLEEFIAMQCRRHILWRADRLTIGLKLDDSLTQNLQGSLVP